MLSVNHKPSRIRSRGDGGLGVAVIGGGFAGRAHVDAIRRTGAARSISLAEVSKAAAEEAGRALGLEGVSHDYRRLLADEAIEVVHNCLPNALHAEVSAAALVAGKHVISEKPLAVTGSDAEELARLAEKAGVTHAVCFNYRFFALVREMRARIAAGSIGRPLIVHGDYLQDWLLRQTDYNWRISVERGGPSRAVADIGCHWIDLASFVLGQRVTAVYAEFGRAYEQRLRPLQETNTFATSAAGSSLVDVHTEDWASLLLRFEGGVKGQLLVSQVSAGSKNRLRLQVDGSEAALQWGQERPEELWVGRRGRPSELLVKDPEVLLPDAAAHAALPAGHIEGWHDALVKLVGAVYRTIQDGAAPDFPTFADGVEAARFIEAVLTSSRTGEWQTVETRTTDREES